jgi:hypothetical protein
VSVPTVRESGEPSAFPPGTPQAKASMPGGNATDAPVNYSLLRSYCLVSVMVAPDTRSS